jgi:hypothetical protein
MASVKENWMSTVDVATYKFTLYIVNDEIMNEPGILAENDTAALNSGGAVVIAESGVTGEYAVENVILTSNTTAGIEAGYSFPTFMSFEIYEPLGFSLLDRLLIVAERFGNVGKNLHGLNYVMKLEFLGRDPLSGASVKYPGAFIYPINFRTINGSLGPAGSKYYVEATVTILTAQTHDTVTRTDLVVENVSTVQTFIENLEVALNQAERNLTPPGDPELGSQPLREFVVRLGDSTNIVADPERRITTFDLGPQPWSGTANPDTSDGISANTQNVEVRDIVFNNETQLTARISELLEVNVPSWSEYVNTSRDENFYVPVPYVNVEREMLDEIDPFTNQPRRRITLTVEVLINRTTSPSDAATAEQLLTDSELQQQRFDTLGIAKKYNYLYSGENTEILDYQIEVMNLFLNAIAPGAGIYYADNNQQFVPTNPVRVSTDRNASTQLTSRQRANQSARFLSDIQVERIEIQNVPAFEYVGASMTAQQKNEHTGLSDEIMSRLAIQTARRNKDAINITLEVRGDPFWLGTPDQRGIPADGVNVAAYDSLEPLIGIVNWQPNAEDLLEHQRRGPVDLIGSGVFRVTSLTSKFQMGQFTQTLEAIKDSNTNTFAVLTQLINIEVLP